MVDNRARSKADRTPPHAPVGKTRAAQRAAAQRRERRRRLLLTVGAPVLVVVLVVVGFVVVRATRGPASATSTTTTTTSSAARTSAGTVLAAELAAIPASAFDAVGAVPSVRAPAAVTGTPLTANGTARVLYVGAEYCPYCAGERWAVVAALSRFGTFSNLGTTSSSATDVYPNTASLSFSGATYRSSLLSFTGVEQQSNVPAAGGGFTALDTLGPADAALLQKYDSAGSIPFVDIGNRYVVVGAGYDVSVLQGLTQAQIAAQLSDPTSAVGTQVLGAANVLTAALCRTTGNQPAAVCSSSAVTSAQLP